MADYNQNIKVTASTKDAERELSKLDKILKGLSTYVIDPGKGAAQAGVKLAQRNLQEYGRTLGAIDRQLGGFGKRLGDIAKAFDFGAKTAVGVAGINALGTALAALPKFATGGTQALQTFGGVLAGLSAPATKVAAALAALGPQGLATAGGIAAATAAFMAFSPAVRKVVTGLDNLALGGKIQGALGGIKGKVEETKQSFLGLNTTIETTVQAMNELAEGMSLRQLNSQVSSLTKEMQSFHSSTQQAWEAAQGLVRAQKAQVVEQRALNDLVRQAKGLQPQDVRDAEVSRRKTNLTSGRNAQQQLQAQAKETEQLQQALLKLEQASAAVENGKLEQRWKLDQAAAAKLREEAEALQAQLQRMARASSSTGIRKTEASAAVQERRELERSVALMRERNALLRGNANQYGGMAGPGNDTRANQPQYRRMLNEQVLAARNLGKERRTAMELANRELQFEMRLETVMKRRAALAKQGNQQRSRRDTFGAKLEGAAIGGAFPLLFGGGAGSVIGGALGGLNTANPIFSVFTSAIGQMLDQFAAAAQDTGKALRDPITNFQKLADAGLLASKSQEYYISRLIEVGRITEATAVIQGEMVKKIGVTGVNDLTKLGESSDKLAKAWAELNLQMQAALAGPLAGLLDWITSVVKVFGDANRSGNAVQDILKGLNPQQQQAFQKEMLQNNARYGTSPKAFEEERKIMERYRALAKPQQLRPTKDDPAVLQKAADDALAKAERAEALRRQGIQLQRQTQDLELQIADQVYGFRKRADDLERATLDLRRSIEDEIFKKRQDITRLEADNDRKRAQIAIERTDLLLNAGRITDNRPGGDLANQMLDALRQYFRSKAEGEANLQQKQRNFTIEMEDIRRASGRFQLEVARKAADIERQGVELNRDIERAKLTTARAVYDLQVQAADYQLARMKESISLMTDTNQRLSATSGLTGQVAGPYGALSGLIGGVESYGGNYGAFNRGGSNNGHTAHGSGIDPNLVNMTIAEIQRRQLAPGVPRNQQLHAVGKYQIIGGTLRGLLNGSYGNTGVTANDKFTPEVQENLFAALARNRLVPGSVNKSMAGLRQEWIGLQNVPDAQLAPIVKMLLDGKGTGLPTSAAPAAAPKLPASVGQAQAQLNGSKATGAIDVSKLLAQDKALTQMLLNAKTTSMELDATLDGLSVEGFKQQLDLTRQTIVASLTAPLDDIIKKQRDQAAYEREYAGLIKQGTNPALAEQIAQIRETVRLQLEQLDTVEKNLIGLQASLGVRLLETKSLEEQKRIIDQIFETQKALEELRGNAVPAIKGKGTAAEKGAVDGAAGQRIRDYITKLQGELNDTEGMIISLAGTIESEIGSAMSNAITGLITGTMTVQQAMSQMFANIGKAFIDMATQMIAKALVMKVLGIFGNSLGGGGFGGFSGAGPYQFPSGGGFAGGFTLPKLYASGGFVTGPTPAVVGEAGSEYVIPAGKMPEAMNRYAAGRRGSSVIPDSSGGGGAGGGGGHYTLETVVINNIEYATVEQVRAMGRQSAQQGAAGGHSRVMGDLRNRRSTRSRLGLA